MELVVASAYLLAPAAVIMLSHRYRWVDRIGVVIVCYAIGMGTGLGNLLPASLMRVPETLSQGVIVLALPMLLFSLDVRQWSKTAGKALLSLLCAVVSVTCLATALFYTYWDGAEGAAHYVAMSVGVYSGGTPNLAAIKAGLDIPNAHYLAFHSVESLVGGLYFVFMLTLGIPLFRALLPIANPTASMQGAEEREGKAALDGSSVQDEDNYRPLLERANWPQLGAIAALSLLTVAMSTAVTYTWTRMFGANGSSAILIVTLTTLAIALSLIDRVRALALSYRLGMYLVYVFCLAVGSLVSVEQLAAASGSLAVFIIIVVFGGLSLHALLCRLLGVDADTFMVTSVAAVASPPFVPVMARALKNPGAMLIGMTTGVIGYALGSYLGISVGLALQSP